MMNEEYEEIWRNYLTGFFQGIGSSICINEKSGLPNFFTYPICATCNHWYPIHRDGINQIAAPEELDCIEQGLDGDVVNTVSLGDGEYDAYRDHEFYGWCKRYPPIKQEAYSIISFRSLFSFLSRKIPLKISDYQFPLTSTENTCGEWMKGDWVDDFINENKLNKSKE